MPLFYSFLLWSSDAAWKATQVRQSARRVFCLRNPLLVSLPLPSRTTAAISLPLWLLLIPIWGRKYKYLYCYSWHRWPNTKLSVSGSPQGLLSPLWRPLILVATSFQFHTRPTFLTALTLKIQIPLILPLNYHKLCLQRMIKRPAPQAIHTLLILTRIPPHKPFQSRVFLPAAKWRWW